MKKNKIFFISGPSGAGKGTLINLLKKNHSDWVFPPSFSTREMRSGESQGSPYNFISKKEFDEKIKKDEFLEYAIVHGENLYGTDKKSLLSPMEEGNIVIKEFDIQGFQQVRKKLSKDEYCAIFITVSGGEKELIKRINHREKMTDEELERRLKSMKEEFKEEEFYDFVVMNDNKKIMLKEVEDIIKNA